MVTEERLAYRKAGAARAVGVSIDTLDRWIQRGELRSFKIASAVFISASELERFIREREEAGN